MVALADKREALHPQWTTFKKEEPWPRPCIQLVSGQLSKKLIGVKKAMGLKMIDP